MGAALRGSHGDVSEKLVHLGIEIAEAERIVILFLTIFQFF